MGRESLAALTKLPGPRPTVAKVRAAIERLRRAALVAKGASSGTVIDDPLFAEYLRGLSIEDAHVRWSSSPGAATPPLRYGGALHCLKVRSAPHCECDHPIRWIDDHV